MRYLKAIFSKQQKKILPEILLIDKPKGITSYDVIREIKKKYGQLKIGHSGTLDPLATGLLILGVGDGTKRMNEFLGLSKVYEVHILLGVKTDTGDMEGKILEKNAIRFVDEKKVEKICKDMIGEIVLPVPVYSAVKQSGVPLYKKARRGERVVPPKKNMKIETMELLGVLRPGESFVLFVEMKVGSGTYVRSIVEELGRRLGVPATVKELRRTKVGDFEVTDAQKLDDI